MGAYEALCSKLDAVSREEVKQLAEMTYQEGHSSANKETFAADRKRLNRKRQQRGGGTCSMKIKRKLNDAQSINGYLRMDKQRFLIKTDDVKSLFLTKIF